MEVGHLPGDEEQAAPTETEPAVHAVAMSGRKVSRQSHVARSHALPASSDTSQTSRGEPPLVSVTTSAVSQDAPSRLGHGCVLAGGCGREPHAGTQTSTPKYVSKISSLESASDLPEKATWPRLSTYTESANARARVTYCSTMSNVVPSLAT